MWDGAFFKRAFTAHFDVESIERDDVFDIVHVGVRFHKNPEKLYVFDIEQDKFENSKAAIGREIVRQLAVDNTE